MATQPQFDGFDTPDQNWFKLPNRWTDVTRDMSSLAELKVVEYVLRHTWGFREYGLAKRISTNEFMHGRRRSGGSRIDGGTGLSKQSVIDGLKKAVEHGYLVEAVDRSDKGRIKKSYSLRMRGSEAGDAVSPDPSVPPENLDPDVKNLDRGVKDLDTRGLESRHRSKKDTLERNNTGTGSESLSSKLKRLPDNELADEEVAVITEDITTQYDDHNYEPMNRLIARKLPKDKIFQLMSSIRQDPTVEDAGAVFNHRVAQLTQQVGDRQNKASFELRKQNLFKPTTSG